MTARELAEARNRVARQVLARDGEVLPETDRRGRKVAGRVGVVERCSSLSLEQTHADTAPLTVDDLNAEERSVFDTLMSRIDTAIAAVDVAHHMALVARDTTRARNAARGVA